MVFRRYPETKFPETRTCLRRQYRLGAKGAVAKSDFNTAATPTESPPLGLENLCPGALTSTFKILGAKLDRHFTLNDHALSLLALAQTRQCPLSSTGNTGWGLKAGLLAIIADGNAGCRLRNGPTHTGGCPPSDLFAMWRLGGSGEHIAQCAWRCRIPKRGRTVRRRGSPS